MERAFPFEGKAAEMSAQMLGGPAALRPSGATANGSEGVHHSFPAGTPARFLGTDMHYKLPYGSSPGGGFLPLQPAQNIQNFFISSKAFVTHSPSLLWCKSSRLLLGMA